MGCGIRGPALLLVTHAMYLLTTVSYISGEVPTESIVSTRVKYGAVSGVLASVEAFETLEKTGLDVLKCAHHCKRNVTCSAFAISDVKDACKFFPESPTNVTVETAGWNLWQSGTIE